MKGTGFAGLWDSLNFHFGSRLQKETCLALYEKEFNGGKRGEREMGLVTVQTSLLIFKRKNSKK